MLSNKKRYEKEDLLEEVLKTSPEISLPGNFADKVALNATRRFAWQQYFREFLIYLGLVFGIAGLSGGMAFLWMKTSWQEWLYFFAGNAQLIIGINILLVFILFADKVLLRYFFYRVSVKK